MKVGVIGAGTMGQDVYKRQGVYCITAMDTANALAQSLETATNELTPIAIATVKNMCIRDSEGLEYVGKNIFTVQFHPEACPGPQDSGYLFDRFLDMMSK